MYWGVPTKPTKVQKVAISGPWGAAVIIFFCLREGLPLGVKRCQTTLLMS
jgi:hypothetical protein